MLATKPSLTKSPIVWQVTLQPSRLFAAIYFVCLLLALIGLTQCPVHWLVRSALVLVTAVGAVVIYLPTRRLQTLAWCEDESWLFSDETQTHHGRTASGSYRSMVLIVVAIKSECARTQHAIVWRDCVPPSIFSALHIRLALTPRHLLQ